MPDNSGWQEEFHLACFNDECSYYKRGWEWMYEKYAVRASYRYRLDPRTGTESPLPVWSSGAHRDRIVEDDAIATADSSPSHPEEGDGVIPEEHSGNGGDR